MQHPEAQVVLIPSVHMLSFTAIGMPPSFPNCSPLCIFSSICFAFVRASSGRVKSRQLTALFHRFYQKCRYHILAENCFYYSLSDFKCSHFMYVQPARHLFNNFRDFYIRITNGFGITKEFFLIFKNRDFILPENHTWNSAPTDQAGHLLNQAC